MDRKIKERVIIEIISASNFLGNYAEHDNILTFLTKIWNLKRLPSEDPRFTNAYDDIYQHIIRNDDWTMEELFIDRLKILDEDESFFILFLETIVHPTVRVNKIDILTFLNLINNVIQDSGYKLVLGGYFEELPVYRYKESSNLGDLPIDIITNTIPIYLKSYKGSKKNPHFLLIPDSWDDFGNETRFTLLYNSPSVLFCDFGYVKIMKKGIKKTRTVIPDNFTILPEDYCSLGQNVLYYERLKSTLNEQYTSVLLALRDVAIFPKIYELFENNSIFKFSVIRYNDVERLSRTVRFTIEGIKYQEYYKFQYETELPYTKNKLTLNFDFDYNSAFEHRMYALIGKNGTGKTNILSSLALDLANKTSKNFTPHKPIHGKIFTLSYSVFDNFKIPERDASFNFVYCGLKHSDKNKDSNLLQTDEELYINFLDSVGVIKEKNLEQDWYEILSYFIVKDILDIAFEIDFDFNIYKFIPSKFQKIRTYLSSGQSIVLYMISQILSQIRYDSLILFDEPETHLHPNAISSLLNTLFELLKRYQSFCIIATHSPIVIQEIPARNIFIIEREADLAYVRKLEKESFGENLTTITQDIFGNKEVPKHFIYLLKGLIKKGLSYEEIIGLIQSDELPVTSNIKLYIKALMYSNK